MGAGASVVLNNLLDALNNDKSATEEEKQARLNLIGSLIAGITIATGGDAVAASNAAQIETANNHLSDHEMRTLARELQGCEQRKDCTSIAQTYMDKHLANKETFEKVCEVSMGACKIMASEMYDAIYKFQTLGYYSELEGQAADILLAFQQMNVQAKQDASGTITLPTAEAMVEAMGFNPKDEKAKAIILTIAAVVAGKAGTRASGKPFSPENPVSISNSHSVDTITASTRFGGGSRNTPKTVAVGGVDIKADLAEINAGKAILLEGGDIMTSSGRIYGTHPGSSTIFPRSGPGLVQLSQAEFSIYTKIVKSGGLQGGALKAFEGMLNAGNSGLNESSRQKLIELFESKK